MAPAWKRLDALVSRAADRQFAETARLIPTIEATEYSAATPDQSRAEVSVRGIFSLEFGDADLRGQRKQGEFSGVSRIMTAAATFKITAAALAAIPYRITRADLFRFDEQEGAPIYGASTIYPTDAGDAIVYLTREGATE